MTNYYRLYQQLGICPLCRKVKLNKGEKRCPDCSKAQRERMRKYMGERVKNRLCTYCGKPLADGETSRRCKACRDKVNAKRRENWRLYGRPSVHSRYAEDI